MLNFQEVVWMDFCLIPTMNVTLIQVKVRWMQFESILMYSFSVAWDSNSNAILRQFKLMGMNIWGMITWHPSGSIEVSSMTLWNMGWRSEESSLNFRHVCHSQIMSNYRRLFGTGRNGFNGLPFFTLTSPWLQRCAEPHHDLKTWSKHVKTCHGFRWAFFQWSLYLHLGYNLEDS